jgi:hypothetical protein
MEEKQQYQLATQTPAPIMPLPSEGQWAMIERIAQVIGPANNMSAPKMANIILWGTHLGLTIPASIELIQNIQGKTSLAPRGAWALVQNSPVVAETKLTRLTDAKGAFVGYECYIRRDNGFEFTGRWTLDDAKRAGLLKADSGWEKYPENMCMYRAIGFACDVAASDVTCGLTHFLKMPEQYGLAIDDAGNVVDAVSVVSVDPLPAELDRLMNEYGAEAIMAASGGILPDSLDKCAEIEDTIQRAMIIEAEEAGKDGGEKDG